MATRPHIRTPSRSGAPSPLNGARRVVRVSSIGRAAPAPAPVAVARSLRNTDESTFSVETVEPIGTRLSGAGADLVIEPLTTDPIVVADAPTTPSQISITTETKQPLPVVVTSTAPPMSSSSKSTGSSGSSNSAPISLASVGIVTANSQKLIEMALAEFKGAEIIGADWNAVVLFFQGRVRKTSRDLKTEQEKQLHAADLIRLFLNLTYNGNPPEIATYLSDNKVLIPLMNTFSALEKKLLKIDVQDDGACGCCNFFTS
jgi:hypothetical protein